MRLLKEYNSSHYLRNTDNGFIVGKLILGFDRFKNRYHYDYTDINGNTTKKQIFFSPIYYL